MKIKSWRAFFLIFVVVLIGLRLYRYYESTPAFTVNVLNEQQTQSFFENLETEYKQNIVVIKQQPEYQAFCKKVGFCNEDAVHLFELVTFAEKGDLDAIDTMSVISTSGFFQIGTGKRLVEPNFREAEKYFQQLVAAGQVDKLISIADLYLVGDNNLPKNESKAAEFFIKHFDAVTELGQVNQDILFTLESLLGLYQKNIAVDVINAENIEHYKTKFFDVALRLAKEGDLLAQFSLANKMFYFAENREQKRLAYSWYQVATRQLAINRHIYDADKLTAFVSSTLKSMQAELTVEELKAGDELAATWKKGQQLTIN